MIIPPSVRRALLPLRPLVHPLRQWSYAKRGYEHDFGKMNGRAPIPQENQSNRLQEFFGTHREGRGIWKWEHYFEIYDRHFQRFRGKEVHILEIGIYGGGSLDMWRDYFGSRATIYGVDIEPTCRTYERDGVKIFIGDQADRSFWRDFRAQVPALDIVIDDGGHLVHQQIVSLEELLPFLKPGGVYLCEDVQSEYNRFAAYVHGLHRRLNQCAVGDETCKCTPFQAAIASIHAYPFIVVIEKNAELVPELRSRKHGTQWLLK